MKFKDLLNKIKKNKLNVNIDKIREAYEYAREKHKDERRASGDPFIEHPLQVTCILAELKMDTASIAAGLLHDVVEEGKDSIKELENKFGKDIANLVDGVTNLTEIKYREQRDVESLRKVILATTRDIRILIIKLADKLHNMRTIQFLDEEQIKRISQETLDIYAPLASRLGFANIKWELEDLSFKQLQPEMYEKIKEKFNKKRLQREIDVLKIKRVIEKELKKKAIPCKITGRPKNFYSIYKKMIQKQRSFEEIHDLLGLRIITDKVENCYEILGMIHGLWKYIIGEFKDYIAIPKPNGYKSLHTAVIAYNQPVEFQIRTEEMDKIAEEGIAAHWRYKGLEGDKRFDKKLSWLREVLNWQDSVDSKEFLERLKVDFFEEKIYVFTPKGDVINLPKGSCPIDFAYAVHSSIGDKCEGAIVNGRIVPLRYQLKNGNIINILTNKKNNPRRDWLKIVKTIKARNKIKQFFKNKIPVPHAGVKDDIEEIREGLIKLRKYRLAKCCNPIPKDEIVMIESKGKNVIHVKDCVRIRNRETKKVDWEKVKDYEIMVRVIANDRVGLFADILNTVAATGTNVTEIKGKTLGNDVEECSFHMIAEDLDHVKDVVGRIKRVQSVKKISVGDKV